LHPGLVGKVYSLVDVGTEVEPLVKAAGKGENKFSRILKNQGVTDLVFL
jgi:hypothetical protein